MQVTWQIAMENQFYQTVWQDFRAQILPHIHKEYVVRWATSFAWIDNEYTSQREPEVWIAVLSEPGAMWLKLNWPHCPITQVDII